MVDLEVHCLPVATTLDGVGDLGMGITFSSDSGIFQLFFKCHCIGLIWSQPRQTCFSVAVNNTISNPAGLGRWVQREVSGFLHLRSANVLRWV